MVIEEFGCSRFRNYSELHLKFSEKINLFVGENGQGKSNLAEGIYFLIHLDSFRTHRFKNLIQFDNVESQIQAKILKNGTANKTRVEITTKGRKVWFNEHPVEKLSQYITEFYATVFNPDHLHAFRHYPQERRAFFDRFISLHTQNYLKEIREYRTVHSQKNRLLKIGDISSLSDWNSLFLAKSHGILQKRQKIVEAINVKLPELYRDLTGRRETLELMFRPSLGGNPAGWPELLEKAAEKEIRAGFALYGPHRDEFRLTFTEGRPEEFFSQGEFRISLLAAKLVVTKLIEEKLGFRPALILDDLFSELDAAVREKLRRYLFANANQVFITSTERLEGFTDSGAGIMEVRGGQIV